MPNQETVYLDTIDGFEFEDLCAKIFGRLRWGTIERLGMVKDGGRDLVIHQNGGSIVIECKHQPHTSIGRPIIQKLHSAVISSGAVKGIVITTGRFSMDAIQHAAQLSTQTPIELFDIHRITDLADQAGIKLLFSRNESSILSFPASDVPQTKQKLVNRLEHVQSHPKPLSDVIQIIPTNLEIKSKYLLNIDAEQDFTTTVGLIHSLDEHDLPLIVDGIDGSIMNQKVTYFLANSTLIESHEIPSIACPTNRENFTLDERSLVRIAKDHIIDEYTKTVSYRGRNNVSYQKTCVPGERSIRINDVKQVLLPQYSFSVKIISNQYNCTLIQNNTSIFFNSTDLFSCRICHKGIDKKILLCNSCGNITHGPKFFSSHSFVCKNCKKTICRNCAYWFRKLVFFKRILCEECANTKPESKRKLSKRKSGG